VVDSDRPAQSDTLFYGNAKSPNFVGGEPRRFDFRQLPASERYRFALERKADGQNLSVALRWNTAAKPQEFVAPQLPGRGKHFIIWIVSDALGKLTCVQNFEVRDCKVPTVICWNGLSGNILKNGKLILDVQDFIKSSEDNVTPAKQLEFAICKGDSCVNFPLVNGVPQQQITFYCGERGTKVVQIWARDKDGNAHYGSTYFLVQDPFKNCPPDTTSRLPICVKDCFNNGLERFTLQFYSLINPPTIPWNYDLDNKSCFALPRYHNFNPQNHIVRMVKDINPLNGISSYDIVLINKHIDGTEPLKYWKQYLAADANRDGVISKEDTDEIQDLLLGKLIEFKSNNSWRAFPLDFQLIDTTKLLSVPIPDYVSFEAAVKNKGMTFGAVKVGDVNGSATNCFTTTEDRAAPIPLSLPDQQLKTRESIEIPLHITAETPLNGFQFDLQFDPQLIDIQGITPQNIQNFSAENYSRSADGSLRVSWADARASAGAALVLRLRALAPVRLSEALGFADQSIRAEAYTADNAIHPLQLQFEKVVASDAVHIGEPWPNPISGEFFIEIGPDLVDKALLEVSEPNGRILYSGLLLNTLTTLSDNILPNTGVYFWRVTHNTGSKSGKLIKH
jgi:hypothetical protein